MNHLDQNFSRIIILIIIIIIWMTRMISQVDNRQSWILIWCLRCMATSFILLLRLQNSDRILYSQLQLKTKRTNFVKLYNTKDRIRLVRNRTRIISILLRKEKQVSRIIIIIMVVRFLLECRSYVWLHISLTRGKSRFKRSIWVSRRQNAAAIE